MTRAEGREELRELERAWLVSGNVEDQAEWLAARVRAGETSLERLQQAAYLGHPGAISAGLGTWSPGPAVEEEPQEVEASPVQRLLAAGDLPPVLLRRAAAEAAARAVEGTEIDQKRATPRRCVRLALGLEEAPPEDELARLVEACDQIAADEQGGLSLLLGLALLDREGKLGAGDLALKNGRAARAAASAAASLRTLLDREGAPGLAAEALSEGVAAAEDASAEEAWQAEFVAKLLLDQAPLVRPFDPPSPEAEHYEALLEGGAESCTCEEPDRSDPAIEKAAEGGTAEERRTERNYGLAICGLGLLWVLSTDAIGARRIPAAACFVGLALLHFVSLRAVNAIYLAASFFLLLNAITDWWFDWSFWGRSLAVLAGLGCGWSSWAAIKRDSARDSWSLDEVQTK